eukprot:2564722-Ditylum_brightwellii.AAC.1
MEKTDKRKFSVDSPKHQNDAYMRLWDPALQVNHSMGLQADVSSSKCVIKDMTRIHEYSIKKRFQARGCVVAGCGTRRGRHDDGIKTMGSWGGQREWKTWEKKIIHSDAESGLDELLAK